MNRKSQVRKLALFLILGITIFSIVYFAGFTMAIFGEDPTSGGAYSLTAPSEYSFDEINEILTDSNGLQYKADGEKLRILLDNRTLKFEVKSQDYDYSMAPTDSLSHINGNDKHSIEYKKNDNSLDILQNVTFFQHKDRKMKIEHKLKNNGPQIKKVKFYYVFSVEPTDDIEIDGQTCTGLGVCVNDSNVDRPNTINFNDEYDFKYQDLIENDYQYQGSEFKDGELILKFKHKTKDNLESGEELLLDPSFSSNKVEGVSMAPLSANTFVIGWCDETQDDMSIAVYYTNGTNILAAMDVDSSAGVCQTDESSIDVAGFNSSSFAVVWNSDALAQVEYGVWSIDGTEITSPVLVNDSLANVIKVSVTAFNESDIGIIWSESENFDVNYIRYDVAGNAKTSRNLISTLANGNAAVDIDAYNETDSFIIWTEDNGLLDDIYLTRVNYNGANVTSRVIIDGDDIQTYGQTVSVAVINSSLILSSWKHPQNPTSTYYKFFDSQLNNFTGPIVIDSDTGSTGTGSEVAKIGNKSILAWADRSSDTDTTFIVFNNTRTNFSEEIVVDSAYAIGGGLAVTSSKYSTGISLSNERLIIAWVNSTGGFFGAYQANGTIWDGELDAIILREPINDDEVLNVVDDTLNITINNFQAAQIWYTIDESETNTTICLDASATCDDNQTTITYGRQGYFNVTVYANKSDGTLFSTTSTDVFVGNRTAFSFNNDSYVSQASPDTNYGTEQFMRVGLTNPSVNEMFIKSDLSSLNGKLIVNSTLYLFESPDQASASGGRYAIYKIITDWSENNLTWNTKPDLETTVFSQATSCGSSACWTEFNVTGLIDNLTSSSDFGFSIRNTTESISWFSTSKEEASNNPYINVTYYSENSAPSTPTLETPADASTTGGNASIFFNWTSIDPDNDTLTYYLYLEYEDSTPDDIINVTYNAISGNYNTVNWTNASDGFIDGTYYWKVIAHDPTNDNVTSSIYSFQISTSVPSVNLQHPANNQWFKESTVNFNFTATDDNLQTCELWGNWTDGWHNNFSWVLPNSGVQNFTNVEIADGWYKWNIRCNNTGNTYGWGLNRTFGVDTVLPVINITYPFNSSNVADENLGVNFTIIETNLFSVWWSRLTSLVNNTIAKGLNITGQVWNYGWNNVTVYANDSAGNENSSRVSFFLNQPLTINLVSPVDEANLTGLSKTFVASASDGDTLDNITHYIWYSNSTLYTTNYSNINEDDNTSAWSYTFEEYNDYLWNVRVCDIFNNCNFSDSNYTLRIYEDEFSIDTLTSTQNTLALTTVLQATTTKPENNELVWFNFTLEKQNGEVILSSENGTHYNGQQNINSTTSPLLNSTGIYNVTALLRDRFGTLIQFNSTFQVNYSLSISPSNTTFVATQAKNETNTFQVTLFDDTQGNITYTLTVAIDDPNNFTTSMTPSTILLNHSDSISAPLQSLFSVNASNQVDNGTYTGNITISNSTYGIEELVFFAYGINPPGGIPRLFFTNGTACNTSATVCDESLSIKRATTYNVIRRVKNTGYFDMTSCSPKLQNTSGTQYTLEDAGWVTMTPTIFNLAQNATQDITITISPGAGLLTTENYEGSFFVRCENADLIGNSQDAPTEDWPFISVSIFEGVVPGGSGGSGGAVPFSVVNVSQEVEEALAGFCGNKICELDAGENFLQCQEDCAGDLTLLSDCVGFNPDEWGPNCIFRSTDALIWIFAVMVAVIVFALLFEVEPKRGGGSKLVFQPVGTKRRRRR